MAAMTLDEYLNRAGALTVAQLRERIGIKSDMQVRQWRHGYAGRRPSPEYAVAIETATDGAVRRWDTRPTDWHRIWPELIGAVGAPEPPSAPEPAEPVRQVAAETPAPANDHAAASEPRREVVQRRGDRRVNQPDRRTGPGTCDRRDGERREG